MTKVEAQDEKPKVSVELKCRNCEKDIGFTLVWTGTNKTHTLSTKDYELACYTCRMVHRFSMTWAPTTLIDVEELETKYHQCNRKTKTS